MSYRSSIAVCAAMLSLALAGCQGESTIAPETTQSNDGGALAMRLPADVVTAADPEADSIRVLVVKLATKDSTQKVWKLSEGELLLPSLPAGSCSLFVELFRRDAGSDPATAAAGQGPRLVTHRSSSAVTILSGKSVSAAVSLRPVVGSLSLNVSFYGNLDDLAPPLPSPAGGAYSASQSVSLATRGGVGTIQWRTEDAKSGTTNPWQAYTGAIAIKKSAVLYFRTIIGADTGLIGTANYTITLPASPGVLLNFTNPLAAAPGWNGLVLANAGNSASGAVVVGAPGGNPAARATHTFLGSVAGPNWVVMRFNVASSNWQNLNISMLAISSQPRSARVTVLSSDSAYTAAVAAGGGLGTTVMLPTAAQSLAISRSILQPFGSLPAGLSVEDILSTVTGIEVTYGCPGSSASQPPTCAETNGFVAIDDLKLGN